MSYLADANLTWECRIRGHRFVRDALYICAECGVEDQIGYSILRLPGTRAVSSWLQRAEAVE